MSDRFGPAIHRVAEVLSLAVRHSGKSRRSLEDEMGLSRGYLSQLLSGDIDLRVSHVHMILDAIGLAPAEFYKLVYSPLQSSGAVDGRLLESLQGAMEPQGTNQGSGLTARELDALVLSSLARLLGLNREQVDAQDGATATSD